MQMSAHYVCTPALEKFLPVPMLPGNLATTANAALQEALTNADIMSCALYGIYVPFSVCTMRNTREVILTMNAVTVFVFAILAVSVAYATKKPELQLVQAVNFTL